MTAMGVDRAKKRHSTNVTDARRRALVTGGSRGIGLAVCKELASRGHAVSFVYRSNEAAARDACVELESLGVPVLGIRSDLSVAKQASAAVAQAWDAWGGFDVLVHSAGAPAPWKPLRDLEAEEWSRFVGTDLGGFFNVLSPTLLRMHERRAGCVVAISSIAAQACQARAGAAAAAKAGLEALVRVAAREEGRAGIRVNAVAVGLTDTGMGAEATRQWGEDIAKRVVDAAALRRIGQPAEIAKAVAFLASDEASYITGKVLQVDGGQIIAG